MCVKVGNTCTELKTETKQPLNPCIARLCGCFFMDSKRQKWVKKGEALKYVFRLFCRLLQSKEIDSATITCCSTFVESKPE